MNSNFISLPSLHIFQAEDCKSARQAIQSINQAVGWSSNDRLALNYLTSPKAYVVVAKAENTIMGYAIMKEKKDSNYYLSFIAVKPTDQHHHIGLALMLHLMTYLKNKQVEKLTLDYRANNLKVDHFYKKAAEIATQEFGSLIKIEIKDKGSYKNGDRKVKCTYYLNLSWSSHE